MKLHLDGIRTFRQVQMSYAPVDHDDPDCKESAHSAWSHISLPAHALICCAKTTAQQGIRASVMLATGILTGDRHRLKFAAVDILSIIVQLIALPLIAVAAFFSPDYVKGKLESNAQTKDLYFSPSMPLVQEPDDKVTSYTVFVREFFQKVTFPVQTMMTTLTNAVHTILSVSAYKTRDSLSDQACDIFCGTCVTGFAPRSEIRKGHGFEYVTPESILDNPLDGHVE